ncbi:hypothetical protein TWF506_002523 [Arthrobotrys conoides]|uniref:Uncharacterized protein n=1 Tax=Arthrobotrys conoides TaxID=74498 RepID=A0AAN8NIH1_9PEZI
MVIGFSEMNLKNFLDIGTGLYSGVEFILFICWGLLELTSKLSTKESSRITPSDTTKPLEAFSDKQDTPSYKELFPNGADVKEKTEEPELQTSYDNAPQRKTEPESSSRPSGDSRQWEADHKATAEPTVKKRSRGRPRREEVVPPKQNKKKK